jgi:hypothetical protein
MYKLGNLQAFQRMSSGQVSSVFQKEHARTHGIQKHADVQHKVCARNIVHTEYWTDQQWVNDCECILLPLPHMPTRHQAIRTA